VRETESRRGRKKKRTYRKRVALDPPEAVTIAVHALQSFFIELPYFIDSAIADFKAVSVGSPKHAVRHRPAWQYEGDQLLIESQDEEKHIEVELRTETQILSEEQPTIELHPIAQRLIDEQRENLDRVARLMKEEAE